MKKTTFLLIFIAAMIGTVYGQKDPMADQFEKSRRLFKSERFSEGEDASSGWNYILYTLKGKPAKIRETWTSSASREQETRDVYFHENGDVAIVVVYARSKREYSSAPKGGRMIAPPAEIVTFKEGRMIRWRDGKKTMADDDPAWSAKETETLETVRQLVETVEELRKEKNEAR